MCTTIVSFDPLAPVPVLLIGVRDEFLDRAWSGPAWHWPETPTLFGGMDLLAGGTWLAVEPGVPRVACVLNGRGPQAAESIRLSRGALPLRLAAEGKLGFLDLLRYDPFHLVCATPDSAELWSWDGLGLTEQSLGPGLHIVVNSGIDGADSGANGGVESVDANVDAAADPMRARIAHFRPLLERAHRPAPRPGVTTAEAWGDWLPLADGAGLDPEDPRALLVRRSHEGRTWGTSSVSLIALARDGIRYDFSAQPGDPGAWAAIRPE